MRKPGTHERFILYRKEDVTGYSGIGTVAEGIEFSDGTVAMHWCVDGKPRSSVFYESISELEEIHGHGGNTEVVWDF